jgi:hypothetical protein
MKEQIKVPVLVVSVIALVALCLFMGTKAMHAGDLDQGQVQYTPGKPPWLEKDPTKKGPGGAPPSVPAGGPSVDDGTHAPPGVGAPVIGNGK